MGKLGFFEDRGLFSFSPEDNGGVWLRRGLGGWGGFIGDFGM